MKIGLQIFSVRDELLKDYVGTLEKIAAMGYEYIEFANHNAGQGDDAELMPVEEIKGHLDRLGLKVITCHMSAMGPEALEVIDKEIEFAKAIGSNGIVMAMGFYTNKEDALAFAQMLNQLGKKCVDAGLKFYYHNHFQEFGAFDGETVMEILLANTSPEYVQIELDTYWAQRGGVEPISYMKKLGNRLGLVHQKDIPTRLTDNEVNLFNSIELPVTLEKFFPLMNPNGFEDVGEGKMDIKGITEQIDAMEDVEYIIVEKDMSANSALEAVEISLNNLKKILS